MATTTGELRLGKEQQGILESLVAHGSWSRSAGWVWSTLSRTQQLLASLEKHRLVETSEEKVALRRTRSTVYRPSADGVALVAKWRMTRQQLKLATTVVRTADDDYTPAERAALAAGRRLVSVQDLCDPAFTPPAAAPLPARLNPPTRVRSWKVDHAADGLVLTLNGQRFCLGASGPAIVADLRRMELFINTPDEVR